MSVWACAAELIFSPAGGGRYEEGRPSPPKPLATMHKIAAFVRLSRLKFLAAGFAGFGLGAVVAAAHGARIVAATYMLGQLMVTGFHLMTHYANEYFDRESDRHCVPSTYAGGSGILVAGLLAPRTALAAALVCAATGSLAAVLLAVQGNRTAALAGAAIGVLAWSYSAPPARLAGRGWGELTTAVVVTCLVPLAGYAAFTGSIGLPALAATAAPACAMFAMMIAVEWPDRAGDLAAGKRNLVVRLSPAGAARLASCGALLSAPALVLALGGRAPWTGLAAAVMLTPFVWGFVRRIEARPQNAAAAEAIAVRGVLLVMLTLVFEGTGFALLLR